MNFYWTYQSQGQWALWSIKTITSIGTEYTGFLGRVNGVFEDYGFAGYTGTLETSSGRVSVLPGPDDNRCQVEGMSHLFVTLQGAKWATEEAARNECEKL